MERIQSINSERIAWCCTERGISVDQLASDVNIAAVTLNNLMSGEQGLTFIQLRKIANYFGRGVLFFLEPGSVNVERIHTPQFRTLANQKPQLSPKTKALIERAERQRAIYLSLREDLDDADWPQYDPPDIEGQDPKDAAQATREWLALSEDNSFESYRDAVEARGILVFRTNGYAGKWQIPRDNPILGFSLYDQVCPLIVIKKQNAETRQTFTLMHELGHLLLHRMSAIDDEQDLDSQEGTERDANAFSGNLLVPDAFLNTIRDSERPDNVSGYADWLKDQRKRWGVSCEVILRRLLDDGGLGQAEYADYRQWRSQQPDLFSGTGSRMYRHREPKHVFGNTYVRAVLDALNARHITLAKASSHLDSLKINDLHKLENHYAGL